MSVSIIWKFVKKDLSFFKCLLTHYFSFVSHYIYHSSPPADYTIGAPGSHSWSPWCSRRHHCALLVLHRLDVHLPPISPRLELCPPGLCLLEV